MTRDTLSQGLDLCLREVESDEVVVSSSLLLWSVERRQLAPSLLQNMDAPPKSSSVSEVVNSHLFSFELMALHIRYSHRQSWMLEWFHLSNEIHDIPNFSTDGGFEYVDSR